MRILNKNIHCFSHRFLSLTNLALILFAMKALKTLNFPMDNSRLRDLTMFTFLYV